MRQDALRNERPGMRRYNRKGDTQQQDELYRVHYHSSVFPDLAVFIPFDDWVADNRCDRSPGSAYFSLANGE